MPFTSATLPKVETKISEEVSDQGAAPLKVSPLAEPNDYGGLSKLVPFLGHEIGNSVFVLRGLTHGINRKLAEARSGLENLKTRLALFDELGGEFDKLQKAITEAEEISDYAERDISSVSTIVSGLIAVLRGRAEVPQVVPVTDLLNKTFKLSASYLASKGIETRCVIDEALVGHYIACRQGQIMQAVINLVLNSESAILSALVGADDDKSANGATRPQRDIEQRIEVVGRLSDQEVAISVSDWGRGFGASKKGSENNATADAPLLPGGSGIGLSLTRDMIIGNGGRIVLESSSLPTRFSIYLPIVAKPD